MAIQNSDSSFGTLHMNFTLREGRVKMMVVYSVCLDGQKRGRGEQVKKKMILVDLVSKYLGKS